MRAPQVDNSTFDQKIMLRQTAVRALNGVTPVVMETHGGIGDVFGTVYRDVVDGVVFEKDSSRTAVLAHQRPSWAVYEADCVPALQLGAGGHLCVNLLDVDPYGDPWPAIQAFMVSRRPFADSMVVVVNDGLRQKVRGGGSWDSGTLAPVVERWGNDLWGRYLEACEWLMGEAAQAAGYRVVFFDGYYTGVEKKMTHYLAVLNRGTRQ